MIAEANVISSTKIYFSFAHCSFHKVLEKKEEGKKELAQLLNLAYIMSFQLVFRRAFSRQWSQKARL